MVEASQDQIAQMDRREARQETWRPRVSRGRRRGRRGGRRRRGRGRRRGRRRRVNHHLTILFCFHLTTKQDEKEMKISFHSLLILFSNKHYYYYLFFRFLICDIHYFDFTYTIYILVMQ